MYNIIEQRLKDLHRAGNFREIPQEKVGLIDLSSNDYLGIAADGKLYQEFLSHGVDHLAPTSSASRLLAYSQNVYSSLEQTLEHAYGNKYKALLFNSGYHANVGVLSSISKDLVILADKLVHASIIDGMKLGGGIYERFAHNNVASLERMIRKYESSGKPILIVLESVYSMDGDFGPVEEIIALKEKYKNIYVYVDEAHAIGVNGTAGLGLAYNCDVDIVVGTFGKALAGQGAFVLSKPALKEYLVNTSRSFIFSTALPPLIAAWNEFSFRHALEMDSARHHLAMLAGKIQKVLDSGHSNHIQPFMIGDAEKAMRISSRLSDMGFSALAIRRPTVPPGTERIRFSLSAALKAEDIDNLESALNQIRLS